jgi:hypothetical protein
MTALKPTGGGKGHKLDPDALRRAITLAQTMLDEMDERMQEVPELTSIVPPAQETVSQGYTEGGQGVGGSALRTANAVGNKYKQAFDEQHRFIEALVPALQEALRAYESQEEAAANKSKSIGNTV